MLNVKEHSLMVILLQQTSIDYTPYIISGISLVIGTAIGYFAKIIVNHINYRNEYYKMLLAKRIEAYEKIDNLLSQMRKRYPYKENQYYHCFLDNIETYGIFIQEIHSIGINSFWIDTNTHSLLIKLYKLLKKEIKYQTPDDLKVSGVENFNQINSLYEQLDNSLYSNFKELHKINKFIKNIQKN